MLWVLRQVSGQRPQTRLLSQVSTSVVEETSPWKVPLPRYYPKVRVITLSAQVLLRGGPHEKAGWHFSSRFGHRLDMRANKHRQRGERSPEAARTQQHL